MKEKLEQYNLPINVKQKLFKVGKITLEDGTEINESDLRERGVPKQIVMIIDCPYPDTIDSLIYASEYTPYFDQNIDKDNFIVKLIVHLSPIEVLLNEKYQNYFSQFYKDCEHIFCDYRLRQNYDFSGLSELDMLNVNIQKKNYKHYGFIEKLHQNFPEFFPNFTQVASDFFNCFQKHQIDQIIVNKKLIEKSYIIKRYSHYVLAPIHKQGYQIMEQKLNEEKKKNYLQETEQYQKLLNEIKEKSQNEKLQQIDFYSQIIQPEITFLGTGSMQPSQYRNVSSIMVYIDYQQKNSQQLDKNKYYQQKEQQMQQQNENFQTYNNNNSNCLYIILDCGEGTLAQINDKFTSQEEIQHYFQNLSIIFITHYHADHSIGLFQVLKQRKQVLQQLYQNSKDNNKEIQQYPPIFVIVPSIFYVLYKINIDFTEDLGASIVLCQQISTEKLDNLKSLIKLDFKSQFYNNYEYEQIENHLISNYKQYQEFLQKKSLKITAIPVIHVNQSYGIVIELQNNFKISYSGDTRPCQAFIDASQGANVMIHESTFTNNLQVNAEKHFHSTVLEAIESAMKANVKFLILTHFSQRFCNCMINFEENNNDDNNIKNNVQKDQSENKKNKNKKDKNTQNVNNDNNNQKKKKQKKTLECQQVVQEEDQTKYQNIIIQEQLQEQQQQNEVQQPQPIQKIPQKQMNQEQLDFLENYVALAFDQLSFKFSQLFILPKVTKIAQLLYPKDEIQDESDA